MDIINEWDAWELNLTETEIREFFKKGLKFYKLGDKDPWYVVDVIYDDIKKTSEFLVVIKSWAKYRNRWIYNVEWANSLLSDIACKNIWQ